MAPDDVRAVPPKILTGAQRVACLKTHYLLGEKAVSEDWRARLQATTAEMTERSRPRPCLMPLDWSGGYTSIFALRQEVAGAAE